MSDQPFHPHDPDASTKDVAVEETRSVGHDAKEGARQVARTAGAEAQAVAGEARAQVSSLYDQVRSDVTGQAREQTQRAAGGLHGLAGELTQMADGNASGSGMAAGLARQAAERVDAAAGWLEGREPADLLDEVRRYARRNPGTFLAACAVVGFVGGRLTRGLREDATSGGQGGAGRTQALAPVGSVPPPVPVTFDDGYGGRPSAPEGALGVPGAVPGGTAAGTPVTAGATGAGAGITGAGPGPAPVVAGDGEDVYADPDDLTARDPFVDAPDLGQGGDRR